MLRILIACSLLLGFSTGCWHYHHHHDHDCDWGHHHHEHWHGDRW